MVSLSSQPRTGIASNGNHAPQAGSTAVASGPRKRARSKISKVDLAELDRAVLSQLDVENECVSLGVEFTAAPPSSSGWRSCRAIDREDRKPSAAVNVNPASNEYGRYTDHGSGKRSISFFDLAARLSPAFADWKAARDHYAEQVGIDERPRLPAKRKTKSQGSPATVKRLAVEQLTFSNGPASEQFVELWALKTNGVSATAALSAGARAASWVNRHQVIAFPAYCPFNWEKPVAFVIYRRDGKEFPAVEDAGLNERKVHNIRGSSDGLIVCGGGNALQAAECGWVCEGPTDMLAIASRLPDGHVAVTNSGGAGVWPLKDGLDSAFAGKRVMIVMDRDNAGVNGAKLRAINLFRVATEVKIIELPFEVRTSHGKDLRDYINEGNSFGDLEKLASETKPLTAADIEAFASEVENSAPTEDEEEDRGIIREIADLITDDHHFAQDSGGKLYRFLDGVYQAKGEEFVRRQVKHLMVALELSKSWSPRTADSIVEFIRVDAPALWERPPDDIVNVANGLLNVTTRALSPHSPDHLSTVQLPVKFDQAARCPATDKFVSEVFPPDAIDLAWQIAGWLMVPDKSIQKAILLTGEGANGKSTWLTQLTEFIGRKNVTGKSLHRLEDDKYSVAQLIGKLANICPDLPSDHLANTSTFKAIVGGDPVTGEYKFKDSFEFVPFARLVFSANHPPRSSDASPAFFRRWIVVPFERTFAGREEIPRKVLDARLADPAELSGLLNRALDGLARIRDDNHFAEPDSIRRAWQDFHSATDPLAIWLSQNTIEGPNFFITRATLRASYRDFLARSGKPPITDTAFGIALQKLRPDIKPAQRIVNDKKQWCYVGIGLTSGLAGSLGSQGSQGFLHCISRTHAHEDSVREVGDGVDVEQNRENPVNPVNGVNGDSIEDGVV